MRPNFGTVQTDVIHEDHHASFGIESYQTVVNRINWYFDKVFPFSIVG